MEKKQLFNNSLVGFHPNIFIPFLELNININDYDVNENYTIEKDIVLDNNFIDIYNKIEEGYSCNIKVNITNNNSDNWTAILPGYKGGTSLYFRDIIILQTNNRTIITNLNFANIDTSSKTAYIIFIRKELSQSVKDPKKPNHYLSADGTYKYPYAAGIYFSEDNSQVINNNKYWGNYIIKKTNSREYNTLVLISDCSELFNEVAVNDLNYTRVYGIGGYGILNRNLSNSYPYGKTISIEAMIGHDTETIYIELHTNSYALLPCIVKYQNKYYVAIRFGNNNVFANSYLNIIGISSNLLDSYIYLECENKHQSYPTGVEVIHEGTYFDKDNLEKDRNNLLAKTDADGYMSKEDKTKLDNTPVQKILTESEYAALGTAPETDNVLYFVTPD